MTTSNIEKEEYYAVVGDGMSKFKDLKPIYNFPAYITYDKGKSNKLTVKAHFELYKK